MSSRFPGRGGGVAPTGSPRGRRGRGGKKPKPQSRSSQDDKELEDVSEEVWTPFGTQSSTTFGTGKKLISRLDTESERSRSRGPRNADDRLADRLSEFEPTAAQATGEKTLYLTNLKFDITEAKLWDFFGRNFSKLDLERIEIDKPSQYRGPSTAAVYFQNIDDAKAAAGAPRKTYDSIAAPGKVKGKFQARWYPDEKPEPMRQSSNPIPSFDTITVGPPVVYHSPANTVSVQLASTARQSMARSQLSPTAPNFVSATQQSTATRSPVLEIDCINPMLDSFTVTNRLVAMLSPRCNFEPKPVRLTYWRDIKTQRYCYIRFNDANAAAEAAKIIAGADLNGNRITVQVSQIPNANSKSFYLQGRVKVHNVTANWTKVEFHGRVQSRMPPDRFLARVEDATPEYKDSKSYVLIFDYPDTAEVMVGRLHGETLGGSGILSAVKLPVL